MNWCELKLLFKLCREGKSLGRSLHLLYLSRRSVVFSGAGVDFGAKNAQASYYRFVSVDLSTMTYADLYGDGVDVLNVDFEESFDVGSKFSFALVMNTLEHIFNHKVFLDSVARALVVGGDIEGFVPFLHYYHADPNDYYRYTHTGLTRLLEEAGFEDVVVVPICVGSLSVATATLSRLLRFPSLVYIAWLVALFGDSMLNKVWRFNKNIYWGLAFSAKKSAT